ncbi:MAG: aldehyde dehydrogenase family protein [Gemmatimonadaceae bacterium]|nr:aldehyde dehydrogenase family protein [Gemmatimonadaceae bacterium]
MHDQLVRALESQVRRLQLRGPNDAHWEMGGLITAASVAPLARLRDAAVSSGARAVVATHAPDSGLFPPTLLLEVPPDAAVLREETFGPLLPVVPVPDVETAIALANASPFGLSASVWSRSRQRAREIARQLNAGTVVINDVALAAGLAEVPHGGVRQSGYGRSHALAGLEECVRTRAIVDDILPGARQPWWFPYEETMTQDVDAYTRLAHAPTLLQRLMGLGGALRLLLGRR